MIAFSPSPSRDSQPLSDARIQDWLSDDGLAIQGRLLAGAKPPAGPVASEALALATVMKPWKQDASPISKNV